MQFTIGTILIYGATGVCKLTDIREEKMGGVTREYYILSPVYDSRATVYVPTDNEVLTAKMKRILTCGEAEALISADDGRRTEWVEGDKPRKEKFGLIIEDGDRVEIIRLARTLYDRKKCAEQEGKKFHACDENMLLRAQRVLCEELALVLDVPQKEVLDIIYGAGI